jgi:hypothetical protein
MSKEKTEEPSVTHDWRIDFRFSQHLVPLWRSVPTIMIAYSLNGWAQVLRHMPLIHPLRPISRKCDNVASHYVHGHSLAWAVN